MTEEEKQRELDSWVKKAFEEKQGITWIAERMGRSTTYVIKRLRHDDRYKLAHLGKLRSVRSRLPIP